MRFYHMASATVFACVVTLSLGAAAQDAAAPSFTGAYKYAGGKKKIEAAIEKATDDMNFIVRPIARSRLKDTNKAYRTLKIDVSGGKISISRDGAKPIVTSDGGSTNWTREDGSKFKVTQKLNGTKLTQTYSSPEGSRRNVFVLNKDGTAMTMRVKVSSPKLPAAVTYALGYKK